MGLKHMASYTSEAQVKWIGFDMDDCLANVTPAYRFVKAYGVEKTAPLLANSDQIGQTWILRSGIQQIVDKVSSTVKKGDIFGAFLYSNNGSETMVDLVRSMLNLMSNDINPFKVGFHRGFAARTGGKVKTYEDLCNCLHILDMPLPSTADYLVFFDDSEHILSKEISLYKRVRPYKGYTPVYRVAEALESLNDASSELFNLTVVAAIQDEFQREEKIKDQEEQDPSVFIDAIHMLSIL